MNTITQAHADEALKNGADQPTYNLISTFISQQAEALKLVKEMLAHDGYEGSRDWNMMKFHDARDALMATLAQQKGE